MDLEKLGALVAMLQEHDVTEFKYKDEEVSLNMRLGPPPAPIAPMAPMMQAPVAAAVPTAAPAASPAAAAGDPVADGLITIEAPMVGTFYTAPSPGADPFIEVGQTVSVGQSLCIIEAMKLMNQIEAEVSGTVAECLVGDGQPVEYGQPLFRIRPS